MRDFQMEPRWDFLPPPPPGVDTPADTGQGWPGEKVRPPMLAPCMPPAPPAHTQVAPRCFTCKHFEMCKYKRDYLKTVTLIQKDLGNPASSYELVKDYILIPGFVGLPIINDADYFPKEVVFDNSEHKGRFFGAKFDGINYVNVVYKDTKYFILLQLIYSEESSLYELRKCQEAFYKVPYELNKDSLETIQLNLIQWREDIINAKGLHPKHKDVINTTHFSAALECNLYEWNRENFKDAIERLKRQYPYGIPIDEHGRHLYHIATYHVEDYEVPYAPLFIGEPLPPNKPFFPPPPPPPIKPPKRRGDM